MVHTSCFTSDASEEEGGNFIPSSFIVCAAYIAPFTIFFPKDFAVTEDFIAVAGYDGEIRLFDRESRPPRAGGVRNIVTALCIALVNRRQSTHVTSFLCFDQPLCQYLYNKRPMSQRGHPLLRQQAPLDILSINRWPLLLFPAISLPLGLFLHLKATYENTFSFVHAQWGCVLRPFDYTPSSGMLSF